MASDWMAASRRGLALACLGWFTEAYRYNCGDGLYDDGVLEFLIPWGANCMAAGLGRYSTA